MRLRTLLSLLLAGLLMVTSAYIGWLGYSSGRHEIRHAAEQEFALANGTATLQVTEFLDDPANRLLDEFSLRARRGMLNLKDDRALGYDLAERLRVNRTLAWIHYSDAATGHFIGVWRTVDGAVVLNSSTPGQGAAREEIIPPDGREIPYQRPRTGDFDPRQRDWYRNAIGATSTVWSEPYQFMEGVPGVTASRAWRLTDDGPPVGVFGVDFYLKDLQDLLDGVAKKIEGFSLIMEPDGKLICASTDPDAAALEAAIAAWVRANPDFKDSRGPLSSHPARIEVAGVPYVAALAHVDAPSGLKCIVAGMVPEETLFSGINRARSEMEFIGIASVVFAVLTGCFLAYRVSEPLRALERDLAKVGEFQLAAQPSKRSMVAEVNQLRDAGDRMKAGLRSFRKYVPGDLVRRLLASGQEAELGGEMRRLTIFLSDIEGFATYSETTTPNVIVRQLAVYFEVLARRLEQHSGTIDKYIGDGLLAFFNAPEKVEHHENFACRATLIGLQELELQQKEGKLAPFRTRVGLHCGNVLVGNIGTPERFAYTVMGDVVNVTSRLESLNKIYGTTILASGEIREAAGDDFEWRRLDRVAVVGRQASMDIYELMGLKDGVDEARLQRRKMYEEALALYRAGSFWDARRDFGLVVEKCPTDKAARLMMTRCEHLLEQKPAADWDGVFVFTMK